MQQCTMYRGLVEGMGCLGHDGTMGQSIHMFCKVQKMAVKLTGQHFLPI